MSAQPSDFSALEALTGAAAPRDDDLAAFRVACRRAMADHWTAICAGVTLAALAWWPTDAWLYAEHPEVRAAMARLRAGVVVVNLVLLALAWSPWLRRHVEPVAGSALVLELGWIGACLGPARFHFLYLGPIFSVALLVPLRARIGWTLLCAAAAWLAAHAAAAPATLQEWEHLSFLAFTTALGIGLGHVVYRLALGQFLLRRRLAERQAELAALTGSLEERVAEQATLLLDLNRQAATARLKERERVARDLHDGLGQELTGARLVAQATLAGPLPGDARASLTELRDLLDRSHQSLRQALHDLAPAALEEHGLVSAVRAMVEETTRRAGLRAELSLAPLDVAVPPRVAVAAFRVAQEALSNVVRHASARAVAVRLLVDAEVLTLEVADDGVGLPAAAPADRSRFGLLGMRARVQALGGALVLRSARGTTVTVTLPLEVP
jgi:signal transduction histidine kinase